LFINVAALKAKCSKYFGLPLGSCLVTLILTIPLKHKFSIEKAYGLFGKPVNINDSGRLKGEGVLS
jgi:hypothetical protein